MARPKRVVSSNKTIVVIYTNIKLDNFGYMKRHVFNSLNDLKVGDMLKSSSYDTKMQVVKVLETSYKYFNKETGDLSNEYNSSNQFEVRNLRIAEVTDDIVAVKLP